MEWTAERIQGLIRHVLGAVGSVLAYLGVMEASTLEGLIGAIMLVVATVWSYFAPEKTAEPTM